MADQARDAAAGTVATGPAAAAGRPRKVGYRAAAQILAERDPVIARLVEAAGLPKIPAPTETNFAALVRLTVCGFPLHARVSSRDQRGNPQASGLGGRRPRFTISPSSSAHRLLHSASGPRMPSSTPSCSSNAVS